MGERDSLRDLEKEFQPLPCRQSSVTAVFVNTLALNILEDQVRLSTGGRSRVEQARNVRVIERIENVALPGEPLAE